MMRVKRFLSPLILAAALLSGQSAFGDFKKDAASVVEIDLSAQIANQMEVVGEQNARLSHSLTALPSAAVTGPKMIQELDVDGQALQTAALKVEQSIIESLQKLDGQFQNSIPTKELTRSYLASLPRARGDKEFECLATALYFEARGETLRGQRAVAEVIMNRVASKRYPSTICGVVYQGTGRKHQCQFSFSCDGYADRIREQGAYENVAKVARLMIDGLHQQPITGGAIYYHTTAVRPSWAAKKTPTAKLGVHIFYR